MPVKFVDNQQSEDDSELIIDLDMLEVSLRHRPRHQNILFQDQDQDTPSLPVLFDSLGGDLEEDTTTVSVCSIEYIRQHKTARPDLTSVSQKSKKTVKFNELIDNEVREVLLEYDQIIGGISGGDSSEEVSGEELSGEEVRGEEAPKYTFPVYAQVRKSPSDALRKKSANLSPEDVKTRSSQFGTLCDPRLSPASRNRHILTNSDKDNANTSQRQFRPKRLTFDENI